MTGAGKDIGPAAGGDAPEVHASGPPVARVHAGEDVTDDAGKDTIDDAG